MSDHTTRRRFVVSAGALTVTALAGTGGGHDGAGPTEPPASDGMNGSSMDG